MTSMQKIVAYSAIVSGILAVVLAFGSSIHVAHYVFTSGGFTTTVTKIKGKDKTCGWAGYFPYFNNVKDLDNFFGPDPLIINSSQVVDVSHWNTDFVRVLAIGGGGAKVIILQS